MGPSGAGKSTLLDILAGRRGARGVRGHVSVNGHHVSSAAMQRISGYVLQDDVFPGTSTVEEYLMFHAKLRLPVATPESSLQRQVGALVRKLGLTKCRSSRIGDAFVRGISGGEKRRLSIAVELLTKPQILFMDEPTTGLDSTSAKRVIEIMADLSLLGVNVLMSIHQPRIDVFAMMTHILLLSGSGRLVFSGPAAAAPRHFAACGFAPPPTVNVADYMLDVIIKSDAAVVDDLVARFLRSPTHEALVAAHSSASYAAALRGAGARARAQLPAAAKAAAPLTTQIHMLSRRMLRNMYRHPWLFGLNILGTFITAVFMGVVYADMNRMTPGIQDRFSSFFFIVLYLSLVSLSSIPIWREERTLFMRERAAGAYSTAAYLVSVVCFEIVPMRVLPPVFFATLGYQLMGLRPGAAHRLQYWAVVTLCNVAGACMNMAIGAACTSTSLANMTGSLAVLVNLLFGGFLLSPHQLPRGAAWLSSLSYVRYAYEMLVVNEFQGANGFMLTPFAPPGADPKDLPHKDVSGDDILKIFYFSDENGLLDMTGLVLLTCLYLVLTFAILHYRR